MTLLDTLKSLLGLETGERRRETQGEVGVTVEREPEADASSERAVKTGESEPAPVSSPSTGGTESTSGDADAEEADIPDAEGEAAAGDSDEPTDVLEGIGPAYAERLAGAGVDTVGELAAADAAELAVETDVSESRLGRWIERANDF